MKTLAGGVELHSPDDGQVSINGTCTARTVIGHRIVQAIREYSPGVSGARLMPSMEEVLYVVSGVGVCSIDGSAYPLAPGTGVCLAPGVVSTIENPGPATLKIVSVTCPTPPGPAAIATGRPIVLESERDAIRASQDREFRLLVTTDTGSRQVTQFVGWVTTSKAPFHHHTYEEVIFILDGRGILHIKDQPEPSEFGPGSSIYLPAGAVHCLENPGPERIQLLGVFHPCGSPAVAYDDD